jgi:hypothetical protein
MSIPKISISFERYLNVMNTALTFKNVNSLTATHENYKKAQTIHVHYNGFNYK